jgi:NADH-quinone oxidoreductase subunit A
MVASSSLWPFAVFSVSALLVVGTMLTLSYFLGERHRDRQTNEPYESGIMATGNATVRFDVKFYLIAMFFVVFDLEAVFIFAWAVSIRENGWPGYIEMTFFVTVLLVGLLYVWKLGALEWGAFIKHSTEYKVRSTK